MTIEYSSRALSDLRRISSESRAFGPEVAEAVQERLLHYIDHIRREPEGPPLVDGRPGVHVLPLVKYPYCIFYRVTGDTALLLHIRNTSRRAS